MLSDILDVALRLDDQTELLDEGLQMARRLEFEFVEILAVQDVTSHESKFRWVDNAPLEAEKYQKDQTNCRRDPVMMHCKRSARPIAWNRQTYESAGLAQMWEEISAFGYSAGIAVAAHLPDGRHFAIGVDRDKPLPDDSLEVRRLAGELCLFGACLQDVALRLLLNTDQEKDHPKLTPRELEVLRWTMEGKTAWEIGCILGISEQTAARHVSNATRKLDCVNKMQAVVKVLRAGLIH